MRDTLLAETVEEGEARVQGVRDTLLAETVEEGEARVQCFNYMVFFLFIYSFCAQYVCTETFHSLLMPYLL